MTDLSPLGNEQVRQTFSRYLEKNSHCPVVDGGAPSRRRIMLTGFGLFSETPRNEFNVPYNVSGLVVGALAEPEFWPSQTDLLESPPEISGSLKEQIAASALLSPEDAGGRFLGVRDLVVQGEPVTICLLNLAVRWDLAAAILVYEASRFRPDMVLMTGLGSRRSTGVFETGALNSAKQRAGYYGSGAINRQNTPVVAPGQEDALVLPANTPGLEDEQWMTWPAEEIVERAMVYASRIESANRYGRGLFQLTVADEARRTNNYVCNNISYVMLSAAKGLPIRLAGGQVAFEPGAESIQHSDQKIVLPLPEHLKNHGNSIGFFHYPGGASDSVKSLYGWSRVLAATFLSPK